MSNPVNDELSEHIISCYDRQEMDSLFKKDDTGHIDTGNSFICKKCKEVILNYY
jgi:hypothetical protein